MGNLNWVFFSVITMAQIEGEKQKGKLCIASQNVSPGQEGWTRVEMGPDLLRAAPTQVIKVRLFREVGVRPALELCSSRELRGVLLQGDSPEPAAFPGICWEMTGAAAVLRCPQAV